MPTAPDTNDDRDTDYCDYKTATIGEGHFSNSDE